MRIAYVRSSLHKGSGLLNHILEVAQRVKLAGNEVAIITRESQIESKSIEICEISFLGQGIPFLRNLIFPFKALDVLDKFDIVHTQYHPGILLGNIAARFGGKPHVFTFHGFAPVRIWRNYKQKVKMVDHRLGTFLAVHSNLDRIITVSNYLKERLIKGYFVDKRKIEVIYNGVDTERFNLGVNGKSLRRIFKIGESPVVLYLGRLAPYKGIQFLIRAIPRIIDELPNAKFLVTGSARYDMPNLRRLIKPVKESVIFTGYVPNEDVPKLYACCDVFCYPSLWEGFGLTPAEAQACGKPVVAFRNCALPEVVKDQETGLLVEPRNVSDLADALISLLEDPERCHSMGIEGNRHVFNNFSWDKAVEKMLRIYDEII